MALAGALAGDGRIGGRFLSPGLDYGEVDTINLCCRTRTVSLARHAAGGSLDGCRAAVLGVTFKPGSDDVRDSASLEVCCRWPPRARTSPCTTRSPPPAPCGCARTAVRRLGRGGGRRRRPRPAAHRMAGIPADRPGCPRCRGRPAQQHRRPVRARRAAVAVSRLVVPCPGPAINSPAARPGGQIARRGRHAMEVYGKMGPRRELSEMPAAPALEVREHERGGCGRSDMRASDPVRQAMQGTDLRLRPRLRSACQPARP